MKPLVHLAWAMILLLASGCPASFDFPLGAPDAKPIDKRLLGSWTTERNSTIVNSFTITSASPTTYDIIVKDRTEWYNLTTDHLIGWVTQIGKLKFICLKPENENQYYHYIYSFDQGILVGGEFNLKYEESFSSTQELRDYVKSNLKNKEVILISGEERWRKQD